MPSGTLISARSRRTRHPVMLAVLAWLLAGLAAADRVRVEPQVGPYRPQEVLFHPTEPFLLLIVEGDGRVSLWDIENNERRTRQLTIYTNANAAFFSADGHSIVTAGRDGKVRLWDLDGVQLWESEESNAHDGAATAVAAEEQVLASAGSGGTVRLWNLDGSPRGQPLRGYEAGYRGVGGVASVAFSPLGDLLASAGSDGTVRLWNLDGSPRGEPLRGYEAGYRGVGGVASVAFSPLGDLLASADSDGTVRLWNLDGTPRGEPLRGHEPGDLGLLIVHSVAFSPLGDLLASAGSDETVRLWNLDGTPRGEPLRGHEGWVNSVAFSPSGNLLASAGIDRTVRLWNLDGTPRADPLRGHKDWVKSVAFSPSGGLLASAGDDGTVRLWNLDGSPRGEPLRGHDGGVNSVGFSPRGDLLVSAGDDGTLRLWNLDGSPRGQPVRGHEGWVKSVAFSPLGNLLASAGFDRTVRLNLDGSPWGEPLRGHKDWVNSVAFSPRGDLLASAGDDGTVRLWNLDGSPRGDPIRGRDGAIYSVGFSPLGDLLASAEDRGSVRLWNLDGSARGERIRGHQRGVKAVVFSPRRDPLRGHKYWVRSVAFSPSGNLLASVGYEGMRLWRVDRQPATELHSFVGPVSSQVGFLRGSLWTLGASGELTYFNKEYHPIARTVIATEGTVVSTPEGWYSGDGPLLGTVLLFAGSGKPPLPHGEAFKKYYQPEEVVATIRGRTCWQVVRATVRRTWRHAKEWHNGLSLRGKAVFWPSTGYAGLLLVIGTIWLLRPAILAARAMPSLTRPELPPWKLLVQALVLIRFLGGTRRALDAWLGAHDDELIARVFAGKESVRSRSSYVDLGNQADLDAWRDAAARGGDAAAWITGPGGGGKSTLAFRMARDHRDAARAHPVLPIVVEEDWGGSLVRHLAELLRIADRRPSEWMVRKLAHSGRLLVLVDGLSERRLADAAEQVRDLWRAGVFRHLLVTSRAAEPPDAAWRKIEVGRLDDQRLPDFVGAYLDEETDATALVDALRAFARGEPIRPLYARLAIDRFRVDGKVPGSAVVLVDAYVRGLCPRGRGALAEPDFLRAARKAAEATIIEELAPRAVDESFLRGFLEAHASAPQDPGPGRGRAGARRSAHAGGKFFASLEVMRRDFPEVGIMAAGSLGVFVFRDVLGSSFLARADAVRIRPFDLAEAAELARPFAERGDALGETTLEALVLSSGGNPALLTYGLESLWPLERPRERDVAGVYARFREENKEFLRDFELSFAEPSLSEAPRRVWERIRQSRGPLSHEELEEACATPHGPLRLDFTDVLDLLQAAGLIRVKGSWSIDPVNVYAVPSLLSLPTRAPSAPDLGAQLRRDLLVLLERIHAAGADFYRPGPPQAGPPPADGGGKRLVPESVFAAYLALGLELLGWKAEREAQHGAGRTDLKLRWNDREEVAVVELKIWGRPKDRDVHRQVEGYWSADVRAGAVVMLSDVEVADWPDACRRRCFGKGMTEVEVEEPDDSPVRARLLWTSTSADGTAVRVDHFLLRVPR